MRKDCASMSDGQEQRGHFRACSAFFIWLQALRVSKAKCSDSPSAQRQLRLAKTESDDLRRAPRLVSLCATTAPSLSGRKPCSRLVVLDFLSSCLYFFGWLNFGQKKFIHVVGEGPPGRLLYFPAFAASSFATLLLARGLWMFSAFRTAPSLLNETIARAPTGKSVSFPVPREP